MGYDLFVADPETLVGALQQAAVRARDASAQPAGEPYWKRAGAGSETEFVKGSTAVSVLITDKRTQFQRLVPMAGDSGMEAKEPPKRFAPGLSLEQIAREVLALFGVS